MEFYLKAEAKTLTAVLGQFPAFYHFILAGLYTTCLSLSKGQGEVLRGEEISIPKWGGHWSRVFAS